MSAAPMLETPVAVDAPMRVRDIAVAARYDVSRRLAQEWLRKAVAAGAVTKIGRLFFARWSALDQWVLDGAKAPIARTRRAPKRDGAQ